MEKLKPIEHQYLKRNLDIFVVFLDGSNKLYGLYKMPEQDRDYSLGTPKLVENFAKFFDFDLKTVKTITLYRIKHTGSIPTELYSLKPKE